MKVGLLLISLPARSVAFSSLCFKTRTRQQLRFEQRKPTCLEAGLGNIDLSVLTLSKGTEVVAALGFIWALAWSMNPDTETMITQRKEDDASEETTKTQELNVSETARQIPAEVVRKTEGPTPDGIGLPKASVLASPSENTEKLSSRTEKNAEGATAIGSKSESEEDISINRASVTIEPKGEPQIVTPPDTRHFTPSELDDMAEPGSETEQISATTPGGIVSQQPETVKMIQPGSDTTASPAASLKREQLYEIPSIAETDQAADLRYYLREKASRDTRERMGEARRQARIDEGKSKARQKVSSKSYNTKLVREKSDVSAQKVTGRTEEEDESAVMGVLKRKEEKKLTVRSLLKKRSLLLGALAVVLGRRLILTVLGM